MADDRYNRWQGLAIARLSILRTVNFSVLFFVKI
jgi:hypothetical protein